jgi:hypothetical protein
MTCSIPLTHAERAEREGKSCAQTRTQRREHRDAAERRDDRDCSCGRVLAETKARPAVHECVVERMH